MPDARRLAANLAQSPGNGAQSHRLRRPQAGIRLALVERLEDRIVPSTFAELEPNNSTAAANKVAIATGDVLTAQPASWLTISGSLSGNDVDDYQFTLAQRSGVFLSTLSRDAGLSSTLDTTLTLFDSTGKQLAFNDNGFDFLTRYPAQSPSPNPQAGPDSDLYADLGPGTYFVQVGKVGGSGDYQLRHAGRLELQHATTRTRQLERRHRHALP